MVILLKDKNNEEEIEEVSLWGQKKILGKKLIK